MGGFCGARRDLRGACGQSADRAWAGLRMRIAAQNRRSPARSPHMGGFARRRRNAPPVENAPPRLGRLRRFLSCASRSVLPRRRAWGGCGDSSPAPAGRYYRAAAPGRVAGTRDSAGQYMAQRAAAPGEVAAIPLLCRPVGTHRAAAPREGSRGRGTARAIYSATRRRAWGDCGDSSPAPAGRYYRAAAPGRVAGTRDSAGNIWRNAPPRLGRLRRPKLAPRSRRHIVFT